MRLLMLLLGKIPVPHYGSMAYDRWIKETGNKVHEKYPTLISRLKENMLAERQASEILFNQPFATVELYRHDVEDIIKFLEWREKS